MAQAGQVDEHGDGDGRGLGRRLGRRQVRAHRQVVGVDEQLDDAGDQVVVERQDEAVEDPDPPGPRARPPAARRGGRAGRPGRPAEPRSRRRRSPRPAGGWRRGGRTRGRRRRPGPGRPGSSRWRRWRARRRRARPGRGRSRPSPPPAPGDRPAPTSRSARAGSAASQRAATSGRPRRSGGDAARVEEGDADVAHRAQRTWPRGGRLPGVGQTVGAGVSGTQISMAPGSTVISRCLTASRSPPSSS